MPNASPILDPALRSKITSAADAAALVRPGADVGMSGFTGAGYPKDVPLVFARRIGAAHGRGEPFRVGVWTGTSTASELDGAPATVVIENRAHADHKPALVEYFNRALEQPPGRHTPHLLDEAFRFLPE